MRKKFALCFSVLFLVLISAVGCQKNDSPAAPSGTSTPFNHVSFYITATPGPDSVATPLPPVIPTYTPVAMSEWQMSGFWHMEADAVCPDFAGRVTPSASNITYRYALMETNTYNSGEANSGSLISPDIFLGTGSSLKFSSLASTECGLSVCQWDVCQVYMTIDGGASWIFLASVANSATWREVSIPLSDYPNYGVKFKFYFDTIDDVGNDYTGWYVDDIRVETP